jgi:hypothetical protein
MIPSHNISYEKQTKTYEHKPTDENIVISPNAAKVNNDDSSKFVFQTSKKILYYNSFFDWPDFHFGLGNDPFVSRNCPVQNCFTTTNRSLLGMMIYKGKHINLHSALDGTK